VRIAVEEEEKTEKKDEKRKRTRDLPGVFC
jgi:hypothetical protein